MRNACISEIHEQKLENDGYFVTPFLENVELDELKARIEDFGFGSLNPSQNDRLKVSVTQLDAKTLAEIHRLLLPLFSEPTRRLLNDYRVARIAVFDKLPGGRGVRVHQHTTLVDEMKCRSLTAWLPLCATDESMGTLRVVRGSHRFSNHIRSYDDFADAFSNISGPVMEAHSESLFLMAGEAVLFDDRLVHWSGPNLTDRARTAIQLELVPREAELVIHYRRNAQMLEAFRLDDSVYQVCSMVEGPPTSLAAVGYRIQPHVCFDDHDFIGLVGATKQPG